MGGSNPVAGVAGQLDAVAAQHFAQEWLEAWNSHDLERILSHYTETVVFRSLKAVALTGAGEVRGKVALRQYWTKALERQPNLSFVLEGVFAGPGTVSILHRNHVGVRAVETLYLDAHGLVHLAAACHELV